MYHNPATRILFRLLAPLFLGCMVYLLVLMAFDSLALLLESFFNTELLVCIGLSYLALEANRFVASRPWFRPPYRHFLLRSLGQLALAVLLTMVLISLALITYFRYQEGLTNPLSFQTELWIFNSIFLFISLLYQGYFLGFGWLQLYYQKAITAEKLREEELQEEIRQYYHSLHPDFLFSGLEAIILQIREGRIEASEESLHTLAGLYQYFLYQEAELLPLTEELKATDKLIFLMKSCGHHLRLQTDQLSAQELLIKPGLLVRLCESLAATQLSSVKAPLLLILKNHQGGLKIEFRENPRLRHTLEEKLSQLNQAFQLTGKKALFFPGEDSSCIQLPAYQLNPHESYHH